MFNWYAALVKFIDLFIRKVLNVEAANFINFLKKHLTNIKGENYKAKKNIIANNYKLNFMCKLAMKVKKLEAVSKLDDCAININMLIISKKEDLFNVIFNAAINYFIEEETFRASAF